MEPIYLLETELAALDASIADIVSQLKELGTELGESVRQSSETWHDNFMFESAKQRSMALESRLRALQEMRHAARIPDIPASNAIVTIGKTVTYTDIDLNEQKIVRIGGYFTIDDGTVSYCSPIGALLMGHRIGSIAEGLIGAAKKRLHIEDIHPMPDSSLFLQ